MSLDRTDFGILRLLQNNAGLSNKQIAAGAGVSESAVKATLQQLFRKARVRTRAQLVRITVEGSLGSTRVAAEPATVRVPRPAASSPHNSAPLKWANATSLAKSSQLSFNCDSSLSGGSARDLVT